MVAAAIISVTATITTVQARPVAYLPMSERSRVSRAMNASSGSSSTALIAWVMTPVLGGLFDWTHAGFYAW